MFCCIQIQLIKLIRLTLCHRCVELRIHNWIQRILFVVHRVNFINLISTVYIHLYIFGIKDPCVIVITVKRRTKNMCKRIGTVCWSYLIQTLVEQLKLFGRATEVKCESDHKSEISFELFHGADSHSLILNQRHERAKPPWSFIDIICHSDECFFHANQMKNQWKYCQLC